MIGYETHRERSELVREAGALIREVDDGTNTSADYELVRLARRLCEADKARRQPVEEAIAAISRVRAEGGTPEEQEGAAAQHMDELHRIEAEMDGIITDLAKLVPAEA